MTLALSKGMSRAEVVEQRRQDGFAVEAADP